MRTLHKIIIIFILLVSGSLKAQFLDKDSSDRIILINIGYGAYQTGGHMADRFGFTNLAGGELGYKFRNQLYFTGGMFFLFGADVREENHMNNLRYNGQTILNINGNPAEIRTWERGYIIPLRVGRIFPRLDPFRANANSGPYLEMGMQFIQHKIRIEDIGNVVPSLAPVFKVGYDRLSNGVGILQSAGYRYFATDKLINFFIAVDFMQHFTEERRDVQYDVADWQVRKRTDLMFGIRAGWTVPIYRMRKGNYFIF